MTIDEMLDMVAQNLNISSAPAPAPSKPTPPCPACDNTQTVAKAETKTAAQPTKATADNTAKADTPLVPYRKHKQLDLTVAKLIAEGVEAAAKIMGVNVVTAIDNEGARLVLLHAMDNSYIASVNAAQEKAYTAAALKMPTHVALEESRGGSLDGYVSGNGILLLGGGFPLERDGIIFGAIGVSGGTKDQDILLAKVGTELFRAFTG